MSSRTAPTPARTPARSMRMRSGCSMNRRSSAPDDRRPHGTSRARARVLATRARPRLHVLGLRHLAALAALFAGAAESALRFSRTGLRPTCRRRPAAQPHQPPASVWPKWLRKSSMMPEIVSIITQICNGELYRQPEEEYRELRHQPAEQAEADVVDEADDQERRRQLHAEREAVGDVADDQPARNRRAAAALRPRTGHSWRPASAASGGGGR